MGESVRFDDSKDRMLAEDTAFDSGGDGGGDDDTREHGLIEIADYLLDSKGDGRDRRVRTPPRSPPPAPTGTRRLRFFSREGERAARENSRCPHRCERSGLRDRAMHHCRSAKRQSRTCRRHLETAAARPFTAYATFTCGMPLPLGSGRDVRQTALRRAVARHGRRISRASRNLTSESGIDEQFLSPDDPQVKRDRRHPAGAPR